MNLHYQEELDKRFQRGKDYLLSQPYLLEELVKTYEREIGDSIRNHAIIEWKEKMVLSQPLQVKETISRQVLFLWALAFAVGSSAGENIKQQSE